MAQLVTNGEEQHISYTPAEKKRAISYFVTSAEDPVYGVINTPPEVFGAFGSFFSRSDKDLRENIWDAIIGDIPGFELSAEEGYANLRALLDEQYQPPHEALTAGISKSQQFFERFYGKYSHKSIANTVWLPMVATNVSQLFANVLAYDQLAFFIEQSTRFVKWDESNILWPDEIMRSSLADTYSQAINSLLSTYYEVYDEALAYYTQSHPFDAWHALQDEVTQQKSQQFLERKYDREMQAKSLDVARSVLPQAALTNIAFIADARSLERDISMWKGHPVKEIRAIADLFERHAGQMAPSLLKYTERDAFYADKYTYDGDFDLGLERDVMTKGAAITDYPEDAFNKFVANVLHPHNPATFDTIYERVRDMSKQDKMRVLQRMVERRGWHDEFIGVDEEADLLKTLVEIRTDLGAARDLRRHQKNDRSELMPPSLDLGYHTPPEIEAIGGKTQQHFDGAMEDARAAEKAINRQFPQYGMYVDPMATMQVLKMSMGLDQLQYMAFTRSTPEGNPSYRQDMYNIVREVAQHLPWLLGYSEPKEGDPVEIYENSPFAQIMYAAQREYERRWNDVSESDRPMPPTPAPLRLRTEDTGLHT